MRRAVGEPHGPRRSRSPVRARRRRGLFSLPVVLLLPIAAAAPAQDAAHTVPTPAAVLGFDPVASGSVVDSRNVARYARAVSDASDRAALLPLGLSTDGAPLWLVMVSSPENLARWRELRHASDKVFALVTCGIHPDEVGSTAAFFPLLHRLVTDPRAPYEMLRENSIVVVVPSMNPDGTDRIAAWLRKVGRAAASPPELYHRYCGHDINRDWLLATQAETRAVIRRVHHVFFPWVTIDLHQMGRLGPRLFVPPYAEPVDPAVAWDIRAHLESLGDQVFDELARTGRQGIVRRWLYDGWTPARSYPSYHGGLRFLLEAASAQYAAALEVRESDLWIFGSGNSPADDHPRPWGGGWWDLPQITDLLVETTLTTLLALQEEPLRSGQRAHFRRVLLQDDGVFLDGRGVDPGVARDLLRRLATTGVRITAGEREGTWILRDPPWGTGWCRSLLLCTPYPAPPVRQGQPSRPGDFNATPYDTATHDLALLAGVRAEPRDEPPGPPKRANDRARALAAWLSGKAPPAAVPESPGRLVTLPGSEQETSWLVTQRTLLTFKQVPDLLEAGVRVHRLIEGSGQLEAQAGDFILEGANRDWIERLVREGADASRLNADALGRIERAPLRYPQRLWVLQGARPSMDEGWLRWVLETYRFRFRRITLDELLVDRDFGRRAAPADSGRNVLIVPEGTLLRPDPRLKSILDDLIERGGRVIALGRASRWIAHTCELPVEEIVLEASALPGSSVHTRLVASAGNGDPVLWGYRAPPVVLYHRGPVWRSDGAAADRGGRAVDAEALLEIDPEQPLACGLLDPSDAAQLRGAVPLLRVRQRRSQGEWLLCGFRPHFRGWTLGTFRLLYNMILAP